MTVGCSHNKCSFCGAYKDVLFKIKDLSVIERDLDYASRYFKNKKRVFLADGDCLIVPQKQLSNIFKSIHHHLPWVNKVSLYGNAKSIRNKSLEDLLVLKKHGLNRIYLGLESGHNEVLQNIQKGETSSSMIEAAQKVQRAKIFLSVTVLLGISGSVSAQQHAIETAKTLNEMMPQQVAALTYMVLPNTTLGKQVESGIFPLSTPKETLKELKVLLENIDINRSQFHANHASSYLPIQGRLPRDKMKMLAEIDQALKGDRELVPEYWRRL